MCSPPKTEPLGLGFADEMRQVLHSDWGNVIGEGCIGVEGLRGGEQATHEGGGKLGQKLKTGRRGSVLVNTWQGASHFDGGNLFGSIEGAVEVVGVLDGAASEGEVDMGQKPETEPLGLGFGERIVEGLVH